MGSTTDAGRAARPSILAEAGRTARAWVLPLAIFLGALIVWDLLVRALGLPQFILPAPTAIAEAWVTHLSELWDSTTYTLVEILLGLVIGCVAGMFFGAVAARWTAIRETALPFAIAVNSIPIIAIAPSSTTGSDSTRSCRRRWSPRSCASSR